MNTLIFEDLFPILNYDNADKYIDHCKFFFPDDPIPCLNYVNTRKKEWYADISFALDKCKEEDNISIDNCKKYAGTNDTAFRLCISEIPKSSINKYYIFLMIGIAFIILLMIVFFFVLYGKK